METIILLCIETSIVFTALLLIGDFFIASRKYRGQQNDHFDGARFYNIGWTKKESLKLEKREDGRGNMLTAFLEWMMKRKQGKWERRTIETIIPEQMVHSGIRITFVGHATVLIQMNGLNILTDPVWSKRASPISWIGPKRYVEPGIGFEDLPQIDLVILSHNHYDHMDIATLKKLKQKYNMPIYTGLGNSQYLKKRGIENVIDMDWWQTNEYAKDASPLMIHFVPAQHFSARGVTDRNRTLWGGFVLEMDGKSIYFAGDTGYGIFVKHIQERFPAGIDIGLLPIGAYKPRWFMAPVHTNPEEALEMQKKLNIKTGIGIHYGTFPLADDSQDDPVIDLEIAQKKDEYNHLDFRVGQNGTAWDL